MHTVSLSLSLVLAHSRVEVPRSKQALSITLDNLFPREIERERERERERISEKDSEEQWRLSS